MNRKKSLPENPNKNINYKGIKLKEIWLAGGCFWGVEAFLARIHGVAETSVGFANGKTEKTTYRDVCYNDTGHAEVVFVKYDQNRVGLRKILS